MIHFLLQCSITDKSLAKLMKFIFSITNQKSKYNKAYPRPKII